MVFFFFLEEQDLGHFVGGAVSSSWGEWGEVLGTDCWLECLG